MVSRIEPTEYFQNQQTQTPKVEYVYVPQYIPQEDTNQAQIIPSWVPFLVLVCVIGSFTLAIYALSKVK